MRGSPVKRGAPARRVDSSDEEDEEEDEQEEFDIEASVCLFSHSPNSTGLTRRGIA